MRGRGSSGSPFGRRQYGPRRTYAYQQGIAQEGSPTRNKAEVGHSLQAQTTCTIVPFYDQQQEQIPCASRNTVFQLQ